MTGISPEEGDTRTSAARRPLPLPSIRQSPRGHRLRYRVRRLLDRLDDPEIRKARRLVTRFRSGAAPEVLVLSDSTAAWIAPSDADRRRLFEMVASRLEPTPVMYTLFGGSYEADLHGRLLELLRPFRASRPVLVLPLWVRGRTRPWVEHPRFGHPRSLSFLRELDPSTPRWQIRRSFPNPTAEEFRRYYQLPHRTVLGDLTVGDYARPLRDPERFRDDPEGRERLIYAYHQGAELAADDPLLEPVRRLGATVAEFDWPVVVYQTPVSVQTGVRHFGSEFADLTARNFARLDAAFRAGYGRDVDILQSGRIFAPGEFVDPSIADEHLNQDGRARLAALLAPRIEQARAAER